MKVHRLVVVIVDHDGVGADGVKEVLEGARYPNRCISLDVIEIESRDIEWSDDHPLNIRTMMRDAFYKLFEGE